MTMTTKETIDPQHVLRALEAATPDLVYVLTPEGRYQYVSGPGAAVLGLTPEQMVGRTWSEVGLPASREEEFRSERERVLASGEPARREVTFDTATGLRAFEYSISPIYGDNRAPEGVIVVSRDITARYDAERSLIESETRYRDLADAMPQIVWAARADGYLDYYNRRWYEFTGFEKGISGDPSWEPILHPDDRQRTKDVWYESVRNGTPFDIEYRFYDRATGNYRWHLGRALPARDAAGTIVRWYGTCTDIEDLKAAQSQIARQNVTLQTLLEITQLLTAELDLNRLLQSVTDAATTLTHAQFGSFFYNVTDDNGESYMLWTISGVPREAFENFPMPRNTAVFAPTFAGQAIVRSEDIRADPRFGHNPPYHGMPKGHLPVVSYLAVPVISRSGEVIGGLFFGHEQKGVFTEESERLVSAIAVQAAIAVDSARLLDASRRAATRLRVEEERYRTLVEATSQVVWSTDPDGVPQEQHSGWRDLVGLTLEESRGGAATQTIHPDDRAEFERVWKSSIDSGQPYAMELRVRTKEGGYHWFFVRGVPVHNEDGTVREWIGTSTNIDERKRIEEATSFIADASALLTASLDPETILTRLAHLAVPRLADWCAIDVAQENAPQQRLIIAHRDEAKASMIREVDRKYRVDPERDPVAQVLRDGKPQLLEYAPPEFLASFAQDERHLEIIRELGLTSWIIVPIVTGGRTYGTLTLVHAESGRRFSERDLAFVEDIASRAGVAVHNAQLYTEAQAANRAKDEFLATLSHELRTPMTAILGWARMLELGSLEPAILTEAIQAIARGAKAQAQLIDDLLDVSRITLGKMHMTFDDVAVNDIVAAAVEAVRATAAVKNIAVDVELDPQHPHVSGDANRLQQVVWNLVNNAVKFTPSGGRVTVSVIVATPEVSIEVADTGEGIAADALEHLFDRFWQADSTTTRRFGGLGLGLAIVKQITELHGGHVAATSEGAGRGATFRVALPLTRTDAPAAKPAKSRRGASEADLEGVDVLVVDDDEETRRFIVAALERAGAAVRDASSVDAGLDALRSRLPHVLLTDIAMPKRDGIAFLQDVRKVLRVPASQLPAIAITAYGGPTERDRILAAGFQKYVLKPADPFELARVVAEVANSAA